MNHDSSTSPAIHTHTISAGPAGAGARADSPLGEFGERLVPLCDGRSGLRGGLTAEVASAPESGERPVIDFIASSDRLDRYDEIIVADGWQLENYRRNPVFQNAHQYGDILFTLGRTLVTEVRGGRLFQRVEFATEANPIARIAYGLYRGKFLNAVSVGFIPVRWENGGPESAFRRKYLEQELLEVSAVGIPANPEALQLGLKAGAIQRADLEEWLSLLRGLVAPSTISSSPMAVPNTHASAPGVRSDGAQWLRLARALARVLRNV